MLDATRTGNWMGTATGGRFYPLDPRAEEVKIEDIAHALSLVCRYNGHCKGHYSVAQHSVLVASQLPQELALQGLLHDAAEAYVMDVPRPLKPFLDGYKEIEAGVMEVIAERFDLTLPLHSEVKRVDTAILADEGRCLMPHTDGWYLPEEPLGIDIEPWPPVTAYTVFLAMFRNLTTGED